MTFHTPIREEGGLVRMFCGHQSGCSPNIEVQFISASMENVIEPWIMVSSLPIHGTTKSPGTYLQKKGLTILDEHTPVPLHVPSTMVFFIFTWLDTFFGEFLHYP